MRVTYTTSLAYYTRNAAGILTKTVLERRQGHNAKPMHIAAQWTLNDLMHDNPAVVCVELYTYGQAMERCSYRNREDDHWTHTDF